MSHVTTFKKYLETQFGISIPKDIVLNEHEDVIRVYSKTTMMMKPAGYLGFVAGKVSTKSIEVKSEFIQLVGKQASKNVLYLDASQARAFVESEYVKVDTKDSGLKIVKFGRHVLGIGELHQNKLYPSFIGKGRKRVKNTINE